MPTPLYSFIATLQTRHTNRPLPPDCSLPVHTHTSGAFPLENADMECETKCEAPLTLPEAPLRYGWVVVYRDQRGRLCGGWDERSTSTVTSCTWNGRTWTVLLKGGQRTALASVEAVGQVTLEGRLCAAWTVRVHGYDGQGDQARGHESRNQS